MATPLGPASWVCCLILTPLLWKTSQEARLRCGAGAGAPLQALSRRCFLHCGEHVDTASPACPEGHGPRPRGRRGKACSVSHGWFLAGRGADGTCGVALVSAHCPSGPCLSQQPRPDQAAAHSLFNVVVALQNLSNKEPIEPAGLADTLLWRKRVVLPARRRPPRPQGGGLPCWPSTRGVVGAVSAS